MRDQLRSGNDDLKGKLSTFGLAWAAFSHHIGSTLLQCLYCWHRSGSLSELRDRNWRQTRWLLQQYFVSTDHTRFEFAYPNSKWHSFLSGVKEIQIFYTDMKWTLNRNSKVLRRIWFQLFFWWRSLANSLDFLRIRYNAFLWNDDLCPMNWSESFENLWLYFVELEIVWHTSCQRRCNWRFSKVCSPTNGWPRSVTTTSSLKVLPCIWSNQK